MPRRLASALGSCVLVLTIGACGPSDKNQGADGGGPADANAADARPLTDADTAPADLQSLLSALRADRDAAMLDQSRLQGWPAPVDGGLLFVSTEGLGRIAGDHDDWIGSEMEADDGFHWIVLDVALGSRYKFTDGTTWRADPWSRAYAWDSEGEMSMVASAQAHLERHFAVGDDDIAPRTLRVWLPAQEPTHVLYVHDGQNLFNPYSAYGGWRLNDNAHDSLLIVGIDNSQARMAEYTHVSDELGSGPIGGLGDKYAAYVQSVVRALVDAHYGEPAVVGTMGSSLGGLIALHIADRYPDDYRFAASLSGTLGWGSIGGQGSDTIIARYQAAGKRGTAIYLDSGGSGTSCADSDNDGTNDDDPSASDNYCETRQLESALVDLGYQYDGDLWHWWEPGAAHNEAAWASRVFRPLQNFTGL